MRRTFGPGGEPEWRAGPAGTRSTARDAGCESTIGAGTAAGITMAEASGREAWWWPATQQKGVESGSGADWWQPPGGMPGMAGEAKAA